LKDNFIAALSLSEDAVNHLKDLPSTVSQIDLPASQFDVFFVYLSEDRLYTVADQTLYVYSMSDHTSPIATYQLASEKYFSGIIANNHLYLGGRNLQVFEMTASITQPLITLRVIDTRSCVFKILRVGHELLLG
jgi:hypothetical protein